MGFPAPADISQTLNAIQRRTYENLRLRIRRLIEDYDGYRQHSLADSVGSSQGFVSKVLRGTETSVPTLERLARAMMLHLSQRDRRALRKQLDNALRIFKGQPPQ